MGFLRGILDRLAAGGFRREAHPHAYFSSLVHFRSSDPAKDYWEAEAPIPEAPGRTSVTLTSPADGPTAGEEAFCRRVLSDLDALFERCRAGFEPHYREWAGSDLPADWRETFELDGISVPPDGDEAAEWEVCWFVEPANHWFTATFRGGRMVSAYVDG